MESSLSFLTLVTTVWLFFSSRMAGGTYIYNVVSYGAKGDGLTNDSPAFLKAWSVACASSQPATMYVPSDGQFLLHPVLFTGPCKNSETTVQVDGHLVALANYTTNAAAGYWIKFDQVVRLTFEGGYLDGKGSTLWACKRASTSCPTGAASLIFNGGTDIVLKGITSVNSELFHFVINNCTNVHAEGLIANASGNSPNTDGIHVEESKGVTIMNASIKTGDDCISIGPGTKNLWIQQVTCGPGHGISVGSLGKNANESGVQNVTVKNTIFTGTENGLRIKSWARLSDGFAKGVVFDGATMINVSNPIIIDQTYCPHQQDCPSQTSGVKISEVTYNNITGTSATQIAAQFNCSSIAPCEDIKLTGIQLTYGKETAESFCLNAYGTSSGVVQPPSCLKSESISSTITYALGLLPQWLPKLDYDT